MASLSKDKSGNRTIQFVAGDRKRRSIRLGKMPQKDANNVTTKVEALNAAAIWQASWDAETAAWVGKLPALLYDKLANVGLIQPLSQMQRLQLADAQARPDELREALQM